MIGSSGRSGERKSKAASEGGKVYKMGFMICNSREETENRFRPLTEYLSQKLGVRFEPVTIDTIDFEQAVREKKLDFTHTNSLLYVIINKNYGTEILAGDVNGKYGPKSSGAIVVMKDSPIKTIKDLKGKRMVFGPMLAPTGYLAEYDMMLTAGINPENDLGHYTIPPGSFKHEKLIYGVLYGMYDVAAAPLLDLENMTREGKVAPDDFVILAQSQPIPYCTFAAAKGTDPSLVKKIKDTLLSLKQADIAAVDGERIKVLKAAGIDGYEELLDSDYDPIRAMAKRVNMPPYQKY